MRILYLTHNRYGHGGSFQRAFSLARAMSRRGHQVTLMTARRASGWATRVESIGAMSVVQVPDLLPARWRHAGLSPLDALGRWLYGRRRSFDLIHGFDHRPAVALPSLALGRGHRIPYVSDWADLWGMDGIAAERPWLARQTLGRLDAWGERALRRRAEGVTTASRDLRERAADLGVGADRLLWLPAGCNDDRLRPMPTEVARRQLGLDPQAPVVVHIGYAPYDQGLLMATVVALAARDRRLLFLSCGRPPDRVPEAAKRLQAEGRWRHLGTVPYEQLAVVLSAGDLHLLPFSDRSINRGRYPNKLGDYLASGRPVLSNPTGDVGALLREERVGVLAPPDPEAMAGAGWALLSDPEACVEMGRRARRLAEGRLSWRSLAADVDAFYRELASPGARAGARPR